MQAETPYLDCSVKPLKIFLRSVIYNQIKDYPENVILYQFLLPRYCAVKILIVFIYWIGTKIKKKLNYKKNENATLENKT